MFDSIENEVLRQCQELKIIVAEQNAKITALSKMQFEADNFLLVEKISDLQKSLDQAKDKLMSEVKLYKEHKSDMTVGLQAECTSNSACGACGAPGCGCSSLGNVPDLASLQQQLQKQKMEIKVLRALCETLKQELEEL